MMYIGNVLSLGSYAYSSIGTDQQSINDEQRRRIVIDIRTSADFEGGWLYLNQFDPANLAHILKHILPFLANTTTDNSSFQHIRGRSPRTSVLWRNAALQGFHFLPLVNE